VAPAEAAGLDAVAQRYAVAVTPTMLGLIDKADHQDPIRAQFIPQALELIQSPEESADPIDDAAFSPLPGLVHRYEDRVLLKVVSVCPVYCRFCFRREMVGPGGEALVGDNLDQALEYIRARSQIFEVILTGGDPFMLSPRRARELTQALAAIEHVKVLRWHSRVPVVAPARVTDDFVHALQAEGVATWVAIHANHPREFTPAAQAAITAMREAGISLVSQSVLLRGVNDRLDVLQDLMRGFVALGIKPYYLHHPDLAPGTGHFRLPIAEGQELMRGLRRTLTGIAQPTYVLDVPGGAFKAPLDPSYLQKTETGLQLLDGHGHWHDYKG
jgi:lysine 2,3-aminomutase